MRGSLAKSRRRKDLRDVVPRVDTSSHKIKSGGAGRQGSYERGIMRAICSKLAAAIAAHDPSPLHCLPCCRKTKPRPRIMTRLVPSSSASPITPHPARPRIHIHARALYPSGRTPPFAARAGGGADTSANRVGRERPDGSARLAWRDACGLGAKHTGRRK